MSYDKQGYNFQWEYCFYVVRSMYGHYYGALMDDFGNLIEIKQSDVSLFSLS